MGKVLIEAVVAVAVIVLGITLFGFDGVDTELEVRNFDSCAAAGNPVMESFPKQCRTKDGRIFVEKLEEWENDGVILMQNSDTGEYACFGCGGANDEGVALCIDPAPVMEIVEESGERYCSNDFKVVEGVKE